MCHVPVASDLEDEMKTAEYANGHYAFWAKWHQ